VPQEPTRCPRNQHSPRNNFGKPRSQQRNAKGDLTTGLRARRQPSKIELGKVKSNETHKCPKSSRKPTSPKMCEGEGKGKQGEGDHLATTPLRSVRTKHSGPRIKKSGHLATAPLRSVRTKHDEPRIKNKVTEHEQKRGQGIRSRAQRQRLYRHIPSSMLPNSGRRDAHATEAALLHRQVWDKSGW
jgi:hypothetical protein